jgi:3-deoxy-D-manno-octulosonate 8-phosphate phosphatase (KDO 8-P phosphatase)
MQLADDAEQRVRKVRLVCLDVDGVLTDGSLWYAAEGEAFKRFHVRDGLGIRLLLFHGIQVAVISARRSGLVERRMQDLKIPHWVVGRDDKSNALDELLQKVSLTPEQVAYVGDDLLDLPVMRRVGLAVAVHDAHPYVRAVAHAVTECAGGSGAVREVADLVLDRQLGLTVAYQRFLDHEAM